MKNRKTSLENVILTNIVMILFFALMAFLLFGSLHYPREARGFDEAAKPLDTEWYRVDENGTEERLIPPVWTDYPKNKLMVVKGILPMIPDDNQMLFFRSSQQDMNIYIDGELRESYSTRSTRPFGKASLSTNVFVEVGPEDSGKEVRVETISPNEYSGTFNSVYIGTFTGIFNLLWSRYGVPLITAMLLLTFGIVTVIMGLILQLRYKFAFSLKYAAWVAVFTSIQAIVESKLRQFYLPNMSVAGAVSYCVIGFVPVIMLMYVDAVQKYRYKKIFRVSIIVSLSSAVLNMILQLFNIQDLFESMTRSYVVFGLTFIVILITFTMDLKRGHFKEIIIPFIGVFLTYVLGVLEVVSQLIHLLDVTDFYLNIAGICLLVFSMTDSLMQVADMDKEKQKAVLANKTKSEFLANMSHEIRTPINAIMGMDEMILRESSEADVRGYATDIKRASENLLDIVNDILDFSKVESGKMDLVLEDYSLSELLCDINNIIKVRAEKKNLEFSITADKNCSLKLHGDESRLRQVLLNLLNNAVKYTDSGKVNLDVGFEKSENAEDGSEVVMRFAIKDTGIGIKEEDRERLFKNFERFDLNRNRNIEGSGLGLAISDRIIRLMKGHIEVSSVYGKGSVFTAYCPQTVVGSEKLGDIRERLEKDEHEFTEYRETFKAPGAKILVVDDVAMNANVIKGLLKKTEIEVHTALSGIDCIEMCKKEKYKMILMDHFMPNMDGIQAFEELKKRNLIDCPVIALTANAISGMKEMYQEKGFDGYLSKPVKPDELEKTVRSFLLDEKNDRK